MAGASLLARPTAMARAIADSDMAAAISAHDWGSTALGPADHWPQSLKSAVRLLLGSRYPMFIWWGPQMVCLYNDAYVDVLGPRHPWALGRAAKEIWGDIWDVVGPQADAVMRDGESTWNDRVLLVMERKGFTEETYFTFSYSPCFDDEGHVGGVFCVCTEDTARVLGDRRLQSLRALAEAVADSPTPQQACASAAAALRDNPHDLPFVAMWLPDGREQLRLAGHAGEVEGTPLAPPVLSMADADPWPVADAIASRDGWLVQDVHRRFLLDAGPWPEAVREALVLPLPSPTPGTPAGLLVAGLNPRRPLDADYRDYLALVSQQVAGAIADARGIEEERRRARALAELDAAKTTFFSNISHELRTPLALMLAPLEEVIADGLLPGDTMHGLMLAQRNGKRLQRLVDALLDFSRIEAGRMRARFQPTDLAQHTAELASFFDSAARRGGLVFEIDCQPLPQPVYVDRLMWEKIVFNLIANALKYTPAGRVLVRMAADGGVARLEVSDTGTGIPAEALPRVFERFFRVEAVQGRSIEGTGIGLALVAELARLHGGTPSVQSEPGRGSTFRIDLPFGTAHLDPASIDETASDEAPDRSHAAGWLDEVEGWFVAEAPDDAQVLSDDDHEPSAPALLEMPRAGGQRRGSILLVDDNADMRSYLGRLLGREHEVRTASDGWQALRRIAERMPDLVLTDVMMGGMDGFQLLERLRSHPETATLPVLMVSAHAGEEARLRALEGGADDFLVKPFQARELLARVSGTLRLSQVRREAMRREQALRSEVEQVLESIAEGFIAVDADWKFTYVNAAAEKIYGRTREQVLGRTLWEAFPELAGSAFEEPFRRAMHDRMPTMVEGPYDPLAGWFDVGVYPVSGGGLSFYFRDVLQSRLMERAIRDSEEQQRFLSEFGELMQRMHDPHEVLDAAVRTIAEHVGADRCMWAFIDEEAGIAQVQGEYRRDGMASRVGTLRLADFNLEQVRMHRQGRPFIVHDAEHDERLVEQRSHYRQAQIGAAVTAGVLRGDKLVAAIALHQRGPRQWHEGEIGLVQAVASRCWEAFERAQVQQHQRQDAEALAQAHAALQQVERRKDQFIATLAHELRNPLAPLRNGVQLLALGGGPDGGARVQAMMRRQIDHLVRLVDDLLEVSRITSGKVVLQKARVDLSELLHGAAESSRPVIEAARHSLHVDVDALAGVQMEGDAMRLGQVFTNLLNNAAKYTEPGGHIAVSARREGGEAVIRVQDNGLGLAADMLEEVFQPFVQVDRSASRAQGGLGIGLSIVRSLVELHGGGVRATSEGPNRGSTFEVRLPVIASAAPAPGSGRPELMLRQQAADGPSVLVVDDNRDAADSLGYMLEMMGASVRVVYGGPDAVAAVDADPPALVLLDIGMPGMDGYQVARKLAAHPARPRMQLVALTGWGQAEDRQRTREAGFDEHLVKPAELEALEALLAKVAAAA